VNRAPTRYNLIALKFVRLITLVLYFSVMAAGQEAAAAGQTILVTPFENKSKAPGIEWIGDAPLIASTRCDEAT